MFSKSKALVVYCLTVTLATIALGSNLGDRHGQLIAAIDGLRTQARLVDLSAIYQTEPWGYVDQPAYLNAACVIETGYAPRELFGLLKQIETKLGREPTFRYGPRTIDLDLLLYGDATIDEPDLQIPHPHMTERAFVLRPVLDVAPDAIHPVQQRSMRQLAEMIDLSGIERWSLRPTLAADFVFHWGRMTYVMGILNITPDSFSGDGLLAIDQARAQARQMQIDGAHVIDIGGESTRPGAQHVDAAEEIRRVVPVIEALRSDGVGPISIDTYKSEVAHAALDAGAAIVNDVWGLRYDPALADLVAKRSVPLIVMHNRSKPQDAAFESRLGGHYVGSTYENLLEDVKRELTESMQLAQRAHIAAQHVIIDPGIGFGKTVAHNLELLDRIDELRVLDRPILVGPSRKSFIGYTLDVPVDQRVEGTAAAVAIAITRGADMVRVHDVVPLARVVRMSDAIVRNNIYLAGSIVKVNG